MSILLEDKRSNRGTRMSALVGEAVEQDEAFWGHSVWNEDEDDESFDEEDEEAEMKPDEFDSDFNDTEDDESDEETDEDSDSRRRKPANKRGFSEPKAKLQKRKLELTDHNDEAEGDEGGAVSQKRAKPRLKVDASLFVDTTSTRSVRDSTKIKTEIGEINRTLLVKPKAKYRPPVVHQFTQMELLQDALETERINMTWLESRKLADKDKAAQERNAIKNKAAHDGSIIRFHSRKGTYNTITFSDDSTFEKYFPQ